MSRFFIDVNLPYYFSLWNSDEFVFVRDINPKMKDSEIWEYAKTNNLTIITKDSDFSERIIIKYPPPKVVHIRLGNIKIKELYDFLNKQWSDIIDYNKKYKLVTVYKNRIEGIN